MKTFILFVSAVACASVVSAQVRIGTGSVTQIYETHCAACHGENLDGGLGGTLLGDNWDYIQDYDGMAEYIAKGNPELGMPAYEAILTPKQIRSLVIYIREKNAQAEEKEKAIADGTGVYSGGGERFRVEDVVTGLEIPWSLAFLPDGRLLIAERAGALRIADQDGSLSEPIEGIPEVWAHGQGGLLEVALHPDYKENGWVYLGFSNKTGEDDDGRARGMTKVVRGRINDGQWVDEEVLFEVPDEFASPSGAHFGTRFVFQDGYLFFSIGDRGRQNQSQDLALPDGKVHRIHDDGRVPEDNPFASQAGAWKTTWSYGNRNAQGLAAHPVTGDLWESEHGPRGGDEINLIEGGVNYGWPVITYGMNYNGTPITDQTHAPGMAQPELYWVPSIAVCGIDFYEGDLFPRWKNNLFVGGLASKELHRLVIEGETVVEDEIILKGLGRIRDVASAPDGSLMLVLNGPGKIVKLVPAN